MKTPKVLDIYDLAYSWGFLTELLARARRNPLIMSDTLRYYGAIEVKEQRLWSEMGNLSLDIVTEVYMGNSDFKEIFQ